jgi:type IV secretory pathway VirD2 relaxase
MPEGNPMETEEHQIHLRRRRIYEAAYRQRAHLPQNLRQLGAVGAVTRPGGPGRQPVIVKVTLPPKGGATTRQHLRYLQHEKGQVRTQAHLYGPGAQDAKAFTQRAEHDAHQFRIIVSPQAEQTEAHRTAFIEGFVQQMERDFGRSLDWVAANHYDTAHPHTHLIVRGMTERGPLYMAKSYMVQGLQDRASALLTRLLGERHHASVRYQQDEGYARERVLLNGMVGGTGDPDVWRMRGQQQSVQGQRQTLMGVQGSERQEQRTGVILGALAQMQQRLDTLHRQQWQRGQSHRREG